MKKIFSLDDLASFAIWHTVDGMAIKVDGKVELLNLLNEKLASLGIHAGIVEQLKAAVEIAQMRGAAACELTDQVRELTKENDRLHAEVRYQDNRCKAYNEQFLKDKQIKAELMTALRDGNWHSEESK